ncbi:protein translocase subunit SecF [Kitasatospora sp. MBT63]|uniref:protein translocase subunit SecF n=1 Tax=Kitasatospora sp. MBT63 TaxID=1444768 RepID=UPI00068DE3C4|nr:protein translocase subunit SecF [Kitasatospora sp. MBT63]
MMNIRNLGHRLHTGQTSINFIGRRKLLYALSGLLLLASVVGLGVRGLSFGIEFSGGSVYTVAAPQVSADQARHAIDEITHDSTAVVQSTDNGQVRIQVSSHEKSDPQQMVGELSQRLGVPAEDINTQIVGPSWGKEISEKAAYGLAIFMALVTVYLAIAFEWRMAMAALVALVHDLVITVGIYALVGFEVTPGTVIGFLTILGYSLYDTVVVFDGVKESTRGLAKQNRRTYSEVANHALNRTLVRSVNTTVLALLPVAALLFIGGGMLGAGTLNDIALALFIGLAVGAYSSICLATPFLAQLKERQPQFRALAAKVARARSDAAAAADNDGVDSAGPAPAPVLAERRST